MGDRPGGVDQTPGDSPTMALAHGADTGEHPVADAGQHLGRYMALERIGSGGMGTVYRAYDPRLLREVALKRLHPDVLDQDGEARLLREAQALAQLDHPNVIAVYDVEPTEDGVILSMEFVRGQTLRDWLKRERPWREILSAFLQAGRGLEAAHAMGLIHRDFKPANVLVGDDGRVRVLDFGLARLTARPDSSCSQPLSSATRGENDSARLTGAGAVMGTPRFMAPEQHTGDPTNATTDQYAFCVSLWHALCHRWPFTGARRVLAEEKAKGPPPWPPGVAFPRVGADAIVRGLSPRPEDRWSSMAELLAELERDPVSTRRRRLALAGVTLALVGGGIGLGRWQSQQAALCSGADEHLVGVWDAQRRRDVENAMREVNLPFVGDAWARVSDNLDRYGDAWVEMHTDACRATSVRGEQSSDVLDLRMDCLYRRRAALSSVVEVLADADAKVLEKAVAISTSMPPVSRCADIDALAAAVAPPDDPEVVEHVQRLRDTLARGRALGRAARYDDARDVIDGVMREAAGIEYVPLELEVLTTRGWLGVHTGAFEQAEEDYTTAYRGALEIGYDEIAAVAVADLMAVLARDLGRPTEAAMLEPATLGLARRIDLGGIGEADALSNFGMVHRIRGHLAEAEEHHRRALEIRERVLGPEAADVAVSLGNLAIVLTQRGSNEEAETKFLRCLEIKRNLYGAEHPTLATTLTNLASFYQRVGRYEEAVEHGRHALGIQERVFGENHQQVANTLGGLAIALAQLGRDKEASETILRSIRIKEDALGPDHPTVAVELSNLAILVSGQGKLDEAEQYLNRALKIQQQTLGTGHIDLASTLTTLGTIHSDRGDFEKAEERHRRALAIKQEVLGTDDATVGVSIGNLAALMAARGRLEEGIDLYREALGIFEAKLGDEHVRTVRTLHGLGGALINAGRPGEARPHLERALSVRAAGKAIPIDLAALQFELARALWDEGKDRDRAVELAHAARDGFAKRSERARLRTVQEWLDAHRR